MDNRHRNEGLRKVCGETQDDKLISPAAEHLIEVAKKAGVRPDTRTGLVGDAIMLGNADYRDEHPLIPEVIPSDIDAKAQDLVGANAEEIAKALAWERQIAFRNLARLLEYKTAMLAFEAPSKAARECAAEQAKLLQSIAKEMLVVERQMRV